MKPLSPILLAPVLATLAACAPTMSPAEASARVIDPILQPGQTWVVNGVRPDGGSETFTLTLGSPRRIPDGRVYYPHQGGEEPVTRAGFTGFIYAPAGDSTPDTLMASRVRHAANGELSGLSGCILPGPGQAKEKTKLLGKYLSLNLEGQPAPGKGGMGICTMTLQR